MGSILEQLRDRELHRFDAGQAVLEQGTRSGRLYILAEGAVEVVKDGVQVAIAAQPGAVFGELSVFLNTAHTATVRTLQASAFYFIENPRALLEASPTMSLHVCELLARRLDAVNRYLVDVKRQFQGHDHIGMVDGVLETLMHRQPARRIRPSDSTIRQGELPE